MDSFSEIQRQSNSVSSKLIKATETTNDLILPTDQGIPFWLIYETPTYKKIKEAHSYLEKYAMKYNKYKNYGIFKQ